MNQHAAAVSKHRLPALAGIAELAEAINEACGNRGVIDPVKLIEETDELTWSMGDYGGKFDGLIRCRGERFHIFLDKKRCRKINGGRGAFTLGHELGHYFIDAHRHWLMGHPEWMHVSHIDDDAAYKIPHEHDANWFSTHLLMPEKPFRRAALSFPMGRDAVLGVQAMFGVSLAAAARRCAEIEVWKCAFLAWDPTGKFRWAFCSSTVSAEYGSPTRSLIDMRADSLTARVVRGESTPGKRVTTADQWFPRLDCVQDRKGFPIERLLVPIEEHVLPQGEWGYLTMLCGNDWYRL